MTLAQRILIKAIEKTGSAERLGRLLGIEPKALNAYIEGTRVIPDPLAHAIADIVLDER